MYVYAAASPPMFNSICHVGVSVCGRSNRIKLVKAFMCHNDKAIDTQPALLHERKKQLADMLTIPGTPV